MGEPFFGVVVAIVEEAEMSLVKECPPRHTRGGKAKNIITRKLDNRNAIGLVQSNSSKNRRRICDLLNDFIYIDVSTFPPHVHEIIEVAKISGVL